MLVKVCDERSAGRWRRHRFDSETQPTTRNRVFAFGTEEVRVRFVGTALVMSPHLGPYVVEYKAFSYYLILSCKRSTETQNDVFVLRNVL